jgi:hypothetical protein
VSETKIADDEVLYRRIPPSQAWFEPPDRATTANFKLRPGEDGLSVYRKSIVSASDVLNKPGTVPGSGLVEATAEQIRAAEDANGNQLHLDVVPVNDEHDPGHAEIRGSALLQHKNSTAKALKRVFVGFATLPYASG